MTAFDTTIIISILFGLYAAWNIGANDVANAMGTSVGSKALTIRQAVIIAAIFEFVGATFFGSHVSETLQRGLINTEVFESNPQMLVQGMLASLLASGIWLQIATYFGLPVSTTHAIVGAIVGFGAIVAGVDAVDWPQVASVATSWILSPLLGGIFSFFLFSLFRKKIFYKKKPLQAALKMLPWIVGLTIFVFFTICIDDQIISTESALTKNSIAIAVSLLGALITVLVKKRMPGPAKKQLKPKPTHDPVLEESLDKANKYLERAKSVSRGMLRYQISSLIDNVKRTKSTVEHKKDTSYIKSEFYWVERIFSTLQISSACLMAFSHGANDVANAMGPLAAIISIAKTGSTTFTSEFPTWILAVGGFGIVLGLATWGWRVIETVGKKITELTPSRGFSAELATAVTVLLATRFGFPVSTTHTLVGSVLGVGLAGGIGSLNLLVIKDILLAWVVTIPAGALLSILCYWGIQTVF